MNRNHETVLRLALAAAGVGLLGSAGAYAGTISWSNSAGGSWDTASNWSGGGKPGSGDNAQIRWNNPGPTTPVTISLDAPQAVSELQFPTYGNQNTTTIGTAADVAAGNTLTLASVFRGDNVGNWQSIAANVVLSDNARFTIRPGYNSGVSVTGSVGGAKSLTKDGTGTLELSGANTYSGGTFVNSGNLNLNFNTSIAPSANILRSDAALTVSGGSMTITGKNAANATNSQTVGGLTVGSGASSLSIANTIASGKTLVALGAVTRNVGGTINFTQPTVNTTISATNGFTTSTANDAGGILGGYATVAGVDWATNNGTNIVKLASYTNDTWAAGTNTTVTADSALADATTHSLRFNAAGARTLTLSGTNTITSGGMLVTSNVGNNVTTITGGKITSGSGDVAVIQNNTSSTVTLASEVADNGVNPVAFTKSGGGLLNVTGATSYTGGTYVNGGILALGGSATSSATTTNSSASVTVPNASLFTVGQTITGTNIPSNTRVTAVDTVNNKITLSQNASGTGSVTVRYYNAMANNALSQSGDIVVTGGTLELANSTYAQTTSGVVKVAGGTISNGTITKTGADYDMQAGSVSSVLAGSVGLVKTTGGSVSLSGANTYTGDTWVKEGSLSASVSGSIKGNLIVGTPGGGPSASYSQSNTPLNASKKVTVYPNGSANMGSSAQNLNTIEIIGGTFDGGSQTYLTSGANVTMTGGTLAGTFYITTPTIKSLASATTASVSATLQKGATFDVADGAAAVDMLFSGAANTASSPLTKNGAGVLKATGVSSYTGATTVNAGTFWVSGAGSINTTSGITVNNAAIFQYDSSVALTKVPTLNNTASFIYNSPAKLASAVTIASGRTLSGSGTFGAVTVNGLLKPGMSPGAMTMDSLVLGGTSTTTMEIGGTVAGTEFDQITIANADSLTFGGTLDIASYAGYDLKQNASYALFNFTGASAGDFAFVKVAGQNLTPAGGTWTGTFDGATYTFSEASGTLAVVIPEPSAVMLGFSVTCAALSLRKRRNA